MRTKPSTVALASGLLLLSTLGCSDKDPPEQQLEEAAERIEEAQEQVVGKRDELADKRVAVARLQEELAKARAELRAAERRLVAAQERLESRATDVAIFRHVQSSLLDDEKFADVAILAEVEDRIVTLHGTVSDRDIRTRALETARTAPGVKQVRDHIAVEADDATPESHS